MTTPIRFCAQCNGRLYGGDVRIDGSGKLVHQQCLGSFVVWDVPYEAEVQDVPQGVIVQRHHPEGEVAEMVNGDISCMDCRTPYPFPLDTTLPHDQWRMINGSADGLLCANCMVARAAKLPGVIAARMTIEFADDVDDDWKSRPDGGPK